MFFTDIHGAKDVKIESIFPENSNSLKIKVVTDENVSVNFTMFGLTDENVNRFVAAFGQPRIWNYLKEASLYPTEMKDLKAENERLKARLAELEEVVDLVRKGEPVVALPAQAMPF